MPATRPLEERFWEKVAKTDDCWLWTASTDGSGYGLIGLGPGKGLGKSHRVAWELHRGEIPEGLCVLHDCDTPACVNPDHLFLGTQKDNAEDREKKGRGNQPTGDRHWTRLYPEKLKRGDAHWTKSQPSSFRGERNPKAKLSKQIAEEIRELHAASGVIYKDLAERFDVNTSTIGRIIRGETW